MPVRKSSFGQMSKPMLMIGVVMFIIVIGVIAYLYNKKKPEPSETTDDDEETTDSPTTSAPVATTASPVGTTVGSVATTASPVATTASPVATTSAPVSILPSTSGNFFIQNKDTGMYLIPNGVTLSTSPPTEPVTLTASENTYTITIGNSSLVPYGDLGGGKNNPGLYGVPTNTTTARNTAFNITQIGSDTVTIQNVVKQSVGAVSWLSSVDNKPNFVMSRNLPNTTWKLIPF